MKVIKERLKILEELVKKYPINLPLNEVADFLDMNAEGLKAALMRGNAPFGFSYQKADKGNRVNIIPTVKFYLWYTNCNAQMVLGNDDLCLRAEAANESSSN